MEIVWLGHSCFKIRGKEATIVTDPFDKTLGYPPRKMTAGIVTISHQNPHHNYIAGVDGNPRAITRPGEYEISHVFINGIATFHDDENGERLGKNTAFLMQIEEINIRHLGDLGHVPTSDQVEQMSATDILMVPVGGVTTLGAAEAVETISLLQPKLVLPMHYKTDAIQIELEPLEKFLKEMGLKEIVSQPKLNISKSNLPITTTTVVLDHQ